MDASRDIKAAIDAAIEGYRKRPFNHSNPFWSGDPDDEPRIDDDDRAAVERMEVVLHPLVEAATALLTQRNQYSKQPANQFDEALFSIIAIYSDEVRPLVVWLEEALDQGECLAEARSRYGSYDDQVRSQYYGSVL